MKLHVLNDLHIENEDFEPPATDADADKFFAIQTARQRVTGFSIIQHHGQRFMPEDAIRLHTASRDGGTIQPYGC